MNNLFFDKLKKENKKINCLILGCGPSLCNINEEYIKKLSEDYLIITIKQAYLKFGEYSDFQFFNCNNISFYERKKAHFICCSPTIPTSGLWGEQEIDLFYHMSGHPKRMSDFENLEDFFKKESMGKYWGPGIMMEIVLPFVYNLGVKKIVTAGWDYHKNEKEIEHFFHENERIFFKNKGNLPYQGENLESIKNSKKINSFFASKNISLECIESDKCFLDSSIKRIKK